MPPDPFLSASAQVVPSSLRTEPPAADRQVSFPDDPAGAAGLIELLAIKTYTAAKDAFAREYLVIHLALNGGNVSRTAAAIGMERSALQVKLRNLGLERVPCTKTELVTKTYTRTYKRTVKAGIRWVQKDQNNGAI